MKLSRRARGDLGRWSPMGELARLRNEINRLFEFPDWPGTTVGEGWAPSVDIYEDEQKLTIQAELPGFKKEDLNVAVSGEVLTISGERKQESEKPEKEPYQSERFYGRFHREIMLPQPVDPQKCEANYKDGILCIYLPKAEEARRKQIEVKTSD